MRDYGVIFTRFWTNPELQRLDDQTKLLGAYLLTGPHSNSLGAYRLPSKYIEEDLNWNRETVLKGFRNLSERTNIYIENIDFRFRVVFSDDQAIFNRIHTADSTAIWYIPLQVPRTDTLNERDPLRMFFIS